ncbi:SMI1/KNR4 family protein [Streptomyces odonnellii]|uniref:SMI1/KNR4 family protein n=1 Tax=Streptomyces odonnellii TaxID=1417980 RepID=UPI0006258A91|nr:SMI1/KNR4 family protein [Streptomyces odonnellii]
MKIYNWRPFLERWSADWEDLVGGSEPWPGFAGVEEQRIREVEERLGVGLPLTYRSFLAVTDGWRAAGTEVGVVGALEGVRWNGDDDAEPGARLQLAVTGADIDVLLDPGDVDADGEWAAYLDRSRADGGPEERYESFLDLMQELFREFHRAHADSPGFTNATTRELDADVEEARTGCLAGDDIDGRLDLFIEADAHGRSRAHGLRLQVEAMLDGGPLDIRELGPLAALERLDPRGAESDTEVESGTGAVSDAAARFDAGAGFDAVAGVGVRTYRYEPSGTFGKAVATARELARWGDTDAAWETIADAVPDWEPNGSEHIAPVGLLADPFLGPVITPERGRYILETPRGEQREEGVVASGEVFASEGEGLGWLADDGEQGGSYRFVLVEGISPEELAVRIGQGAGQEGPLSAPADEREAGDAARIGSCGGDSGWSFAFESRRDTDFAGPLGESAQQSLQESFPAGGLGEKASRGTASVTVWVERGSEAEEEAGTFHFSYAEDGRRQYGFTVHDGEIEEWGTLPESLDPEELFPDPEDFALDPDDEYEALAAITDEYGVSLPRFALTRGRLHTVRTEPWVTGA